MAEETLLEEPGVTITTARAVLHGTTYPIAGITSVSVQTISPSLLPPLLLMLVGAFGALCGFGLGVDDKGADIVLSLMGALLLGGGPGGLGLLIFFTSRASYAVVLSTAAGSRRAFVAKRKEQAQAIAQALNEAIIARG